MWVFVCVCVWLCIGVSVSVSAAALAVITTVFACSPKSEEVGEPAAATMTVDEAFATITQEALESHLNYLADDARMGRMTGEQGHEDAAKYVADHFESLGLERAKTTLYAPPIPDIQPEMVFRPTDLIPLLPGRGWMLIADHTTRTRPPIVD